MYLEVHHGDVALEGDGVVAEVVHELLLLELLRDDGWREEAAEVVRVALRLREGQTLVVPRVSQQRVPAASQRKKFEFKFKFFVMATERSVAIRKDSILKLM